jgi:hypothetical protein
MKQHHQKRHADWLCTPPDENDALLSWEVILLAKSGISPNPYSASAQQAGLQTSSPSQDGLRQQDRSWPCLIPHTPAVPGDLGAPLSLSSSTSTEGLLPCALEYKETVTRFDLPASNIKSKKLDLRVTLNRKDFDPVSALRIELDDLNGLEIAVDETPGDTGIADIDVKHRDLIGDMIKVETMTQRLSDAIRRGEDRVRIVGELQLKQQVQGFLTLGVDLMNDRARRYC